jgi:hypothetical protein
MSNSRLLASFLESLNRKPIIYVLIVTIFNFLLRLIIYYHTVLLRFGDFRAYIDGVDNLFAGKQQYMLEGNFLFGVSYIGYFLEKAFGTIDAFFVLNSFLGALTSIIIFLLVFRVTKNALAGFISVVLLTVYTEYMVFSSVFYSPVIMVFIVSLIILLLYEYLQEDRLINLFLIALGIVFLFLITFFLKPELLYIPYLFILFSVIMFKNHRNPAIKTGILAVLMISGYLAINSFGIISKKEGSVIANDFIFFGHTDYGGDGGEGAFIYKENKERYEDALFEYRKENEFIEGDRESVNNFQRYEIKKFITQHPLRWINIQFQKFFRTFGVVPEGVSFKVLCSGLLKNKIVLTSIVIVAPVVLILILFVILYSGDVIKRLLFLSPDSFPFLTLFVMLFAYYIIASVFYGHYQERYRIPIMVLFVVPVVSYFIACIDIKKLIKKKSVIIKGTILVLFFVVWSSQIVKGLLNRERINNVIELIEAYQGHTI